MPMTRSRRFRVIVVSCAAAAAIACLVVAVSGGPVSPDDPSDTFVVIDRSGRLMLGDTRYRFVGVNVYSLASGRRDGNGFVCGRDLTDEDAVHMLDRIADMGCNVVRLDAYQSFTSGDTDHVRFDLLMRAARQRGIRLIITLENHWADCTQGGIKDAAWYRDGYRRPYGTYPRSYREHVRSFVRRYRDEPAVLMWQLMNEGEVAPTQGFDDPEAFYAFVQDMASLVRRTDPRRPVSIGTTGVGSPGTGGAYYGLLHALDDVGLVEAHDYHNERDPLPRDIRAAMTVARWLRKPFFVGETGIRSPPFGRGERARLLRNKLDAMWAADVDGVVIWSYDAGDGRGNDFGPDDPFTGQLRDFTRYALRPYHRARSRTFDIPGISLH